MTEMPLPDDDQAAAAVREAAEATGGRRVLGARAAGRSGRHDISERIEEIIRSEVAP